MRQVRRNRAAPNYTSSIQFIEPTWQTLSHDRDTTEWNNSMAIWETKQTMNITDVHTPCFWIWKEMISFVRMTGGTQDNIWMCDSCPSPGIVNCEVMKLLYVRPTCLSLIYVLLFWDFTGSTSKSVVFCVYIIPVKVVDVLDVAK